MVRVKIYSDYWPLIECTYFIKWLSSAIARSRNPLLDLSDLTEIPILKNSTADHYLQIDKVTKVAISM